MLGAEGYGSYKIVDGTVEASTIPNPPACASDRLYIVNATLGAGVRVTLEPCGGQAPGAGAACAGAAWSSTWAMSEGIPGS